MPKHVIQKVVLAGTPERLYDIYLDARKHAALTGAPVSIQRKIGSRFKAFGGMLSGKILHLVPGKTIVQTWRSEKFHKGDGDSILTLHFSKVKRGAQIDLVHANIPDHDHADVNKGWHRFYWKPLVSYLNKKKGDSR